MGDASGAPSSTDPVAALLRLEAAITRDVEAGRQRWAAAFAVEQPPAFRDFLYANEEVAVPQRIAELRAKRSAVSSAMMPPEDEGCD